MLCHLVGNEVLDMQGELAPVDTIQESDKFDVLIRKCKQCNQLFVSVFKEINLANGEDDYWNFWVPVTQEEVDVLKKEGLTYLIKLIATKKHLCWSSDNEKYWSDGNPGIEVILHAI